MNRPIFHDRRSAGALLGLEVAKTRLDRPVVLGLPRGGVPVAAQVATEINAPLDVIVVRKLGAPGQPELAMGAIGENGVVVVNDDVLQAGQIDAGVFAEVERRERTTLDGSVVVMRAVRERLDVNGCSAVIVDDGAATGATMRAAIAVARAAGARMVIAATPVAPDDVVEALRSRADGVVCLAQPHPFGSVGRWYRHFEAVTSAEVLDLLTAANRQ